MEKNKIIALTILYVPYNTEEIRHAYKSKYNSNRKNRVILLMIRDGKKWRYLTVRNWNALPRRIIYKFVMRNKKNKKCAIKRILKFND